MKEIVNMLDGFYQRLNIRIVLSHIEVWNHTNLISNSTNPTVVSANLCQVQYYILLIAKLKTNFHSIYFIWIMLKTERSFRKSIV